MKVKLRFATLEYSMLSDSDEDHFSPTLRVIEIEKNGQNCGFHLTRGKWDPYPWVSNVEDGSVANQAGIKAGDCLLEVNGDDIVGKRISEIADIVKSKSEQVSLLVWNAGIDPQCSPEALCCGPIPTNFQRLSACMSSILAFLECPVCLDTISPPTYQCDNGHLICIRCRSKSERCPVCRLRFTRGRSLLSDQVYTALIDAFNLREETDDARSAKIQQIFKNKTKNKNVPDIKITQSQSNKFLTKLVGKAASVDNLSSNSKYLSVSPENRLQQNGNQDDFSGNLKLKSLSSSEIFLTDSPTVSRFSSINRLNEKTLHNFQAETRPASYHGSYESLGRKPKKTDQPTHCSLSSLEVEKNNNKENVAFHCPFKPDCTVKIKEYNKVLEHFQNYHKGPLVQYFDTTISIPLKKLQGDEICYFINEGDDNFFLKTIKICPNKQRNDESDLLLWVWHMGLQEIPKRYEIEVQIKNKEENKLLLKVCGEVFSLISMSFQEIIQKQKGVFLSCKALEALGSSNYLSLCIRNVEANVEYN